MKYVIDASIAEAWYSLNPATSNAGRIRSDFLRGVHELIAPDVFPAECAKMLVRAEHKGVLASGYSSIHVRDLRMIGVALHSSFPLLDRAIAIALTTRLQLFASLYVALAEREQCQLLTTDQKLLRAARRHFSFVIPLASIP
jgi:predicted nucleic acid-binding protein